MSEKAPNRVYDGFVSLDGGMDGGRSPSRLKPNQVAFAWNATMRGEHIHQRPAFLKRTLSYETDWNCGYAYSGAEYEQVDCGTVEENFRAGVFQGASFYQSEVGNNLLVVAVNGHLFKIDVLDGYSVSDISVFDGMAADLNPANILFTHFCQAEKYLVCQDGSSLPIIFNGASSRRATANEIKTGTCMAYTAGRIWYATTPFTFRATDLVLGPSGTAGERYRDAVLKETENDFLNEGGDFVVPQASGGIKSMIAPSNLDTSLGQGPLQVFCANNVFSVNAPLDRTVWKNVQYPLQTVSQIEYGALGGRGVIAINGDLWYRSRDGLRSFIVASRSFGDPTNGPISREVNSILDDDQDNLLEFANGVYFDRRLLFTCYPRFNELGPYHRGLVVLDFDIHSSIREKSPPIWEGVWTGLNILQLVKGEFAGVERTFAFCRSSAGYLQLWEITKNEWFDNGDVRVKWGFETPSYQFGNQFNKKELETAELFVSEIRERVDFTVSYRPDHYPCWLDWHDWSECSTMETCGTTETCLAPKNLHPQYRPRLRLPQPTDDCNAPVKGLYRELYECAFRFEIEGPAKVYQARFKARDIVEEPFGECRGSGTCEELDCCLPELFDYWSAVGVTETESTTDDTTGGGDATDSPSGGDGGDDTTGGGGDTGEGGGGTDTLPPDTDDDTIPGDTVPGSWGLDDPRDTLINPPGSCPDSDTQFCFRSALVWGWDHVPTQVEYDTDTAWRDQIDWHITYFKAEVEALILLNGWTLTSPMDIAWETAVGGWFSPAFGKYPATYDGTTPSSSLFSYICRPVVCIKHT